MSCHLHLGGGGGGSDDNYTVNTLGVARFALAATSVSNLARFGGGAINCLG